MFRFATKKDRPRILFVHIPKCGGMSLYNALAESVGTRRSIRFYQASQDQQELFLAMDEETLREYSLISGHFSYTLFMKQPLADYHAISLLRDPVERELSAYFYMKTYKDHPMYERMKKVDLYEFLDRRIKSERSNRQCSQISGEASFEVAKRTIEENYFLVAPVEYMADFCRILEERLGLPKIVVKRDNETLFRMRRHEIHPEIIDKIVQLNQEDIKLYEYVKEWFEQEYLT